MMLKISYSLDDSVILFCEIFPLGYTVIPPEKFSAKLIKWKLHFLSFVALTVIFQGCFEPHGFFLIPKFHFCLSLFFLIKSSATKTLHNDRVH